MFATPLQMAREYWGQFSYDEIKSVHGIEQEPEDEMERDEEETTEEDEDLCPKCMGMGCNYCLMLNY